MDKSTDKVKLNDELLDQVSGGCERLELDKIIQKL